MNTMEHITVPLARCLQAYAQAYQNAHPGDPEGALEEFKKYYAFDRLWIEELIKTKTEEKRLEESNRQ